MAGGCNSQCIRKHALRYKLGPRSILADLLVLKSMRSVSESPSEDSVQSSIISLA